MSDRLEKWEEDEKWLYENAGKINKRPTADDVESFCERIGIMTANGLSERDARLRAFLELY